MLNGSVSRTCCPNPPHAAQTQGGLLNARRSLARAGSSRCMLLTDFDSWPMVYWWFRRIVRRLLLCTLYDVALMLVREREGRKASPAAGVIDGQSLKMPGATHGGVYEASKRIRECKCYVTVETDRSLLMVHLTPADVQDVAGDEAIMSANRCHWS